MSKFSKKPGFGAMIWGLAIAAIPLLVAIVAGKDVLGVNSVFAVMFGAILALVGLITMLTAKG